MRARLTTLGTILAVFGLLFLAGGGVAYSQIQDGYDSLQAFSETQNVTLNYNEDGQLVDRGSVEEAEAIMDIVTDEWAYPVDASDFDPADPLVNSDSEYMFQMATIIYHTTSGTATVTLDEPALDEDGNVLYEAGTYEVPLEGRYWTEFDRTDPLDGPAREAAWSGTVHGLVGELGVGTVTHSALQMGLGIAAILGGVGGTLLVAGLGMVWVARAPRGEETTTSEQPQQFATA
jgi:hypothetical protein